MRKPKTVDPITLLPFVKDRPNWKVGDRRLPRDFWNVETSGDYEADCKTGNEFARLALDYINAEGFAGLLGWAVLDMVAKGEGVRQRDTRRLHGRNRQTSRLWPRN
jgi:hypothetical protein